MTDGEQYASVSENMDGWQGNGRGTPGAWARRRRLRTFS